MSTENQQTSIEPRFITLEGIEGCGKSVQTRLIESSLKSAGVPLVSTREPGGTPFGEEVRQILLHRDGAPREPIAELLLYLADRYQDLKERIEPALSTGHHVICDRYHDATLAYQGYARRIGFDRIDQLAAALDLRRPDLTLVLDIDIETGLSRARLRMTETNEEIWSLFDEEAMAFHERVRQGYRLLQSREPERIRFVDGSGTPEEVFNRIMLTLEPLGLMKGAAKL